MRRLVVCPACSLQYDASRIPEGERFRCPCGTIVKVPAVGAKEAAVVRCSSCGAPRKDGSSRCVFCSSDFTLRERDLNTVCPACLARIADQSRFCHCCGVAITPQALASDTTSHPCPACGDSRHLTGRKIESDVSFLECRHCGGIWLGHEAFGRLQERARLKEIRWLGEETKDNQALGQSGPLYRKCAICGKQMSRRNFERRSGVIIDICPNHGLWLDLGELERILRWIQSGAMTQAARSELRKARENARFAAIRNPNDPLERAGREEFGGGGKSVTILGGLIRFLVE